MTEWLLGLVPQYGMYLLAVCTFASCLALPIPASMLMLAAGGFVASGDLSLAGSGGQHLPGPSRAIRPGISRAARAGPG